MTSAKFPKQELYTLTEHKPVQYAVSAILFILVFSVLLTVTLPFIENVVINDFLEGKVYNAGQTVEIMKQTPKRLEATNYWTSWAIDIYIGLPQEARYWFNPILSLFMPFSLFSFIVVLMITSILPTNIGFMRQKIEREIIHTFDNINYHLYGYRTESENRELMDQLITADTRDIMSLVEKWDMRFEELRTLQKVLKWKRGSFFYKVINVVVCLEFYLRFYFTEKYNNFILGLVYIGAAVLIIIIGMRGLKFIPSTQPSMVFFALGLEFSVLITYAFTVMFSPPEIESEHKESISPSTNSLLMTDEFSNSKDLENLLKMFIKSSRDTEKK